MRICYLGNSISIHNQRWAEYLAREGHEIHFITLHPFVNIPCVKVYSLYSSLSRYLDIAFIINMRKIKKLIKSIKPHILHAHYLSDYGFYSSCLNFHPLVVSCWGSDVLIDPNKSLRYRLMLRHTCRVADKITVETKSVARILNKKFNVPLSKLEVFSWGINTNIFFKDYKKEVKELCEKFNIKKEYKVIFSPRSIKPIYGIEVIIDAIPIVLQKYPRVIFVFLSGIYDSKYKKKLMKKINILNISKNVLFLDYYLSDNEMAVWYNLSDIFISASYSDTIAISILEGMSCGTIPVISDLEENKKIVKDGKNGFLFPCGRSDILARKIIKALSGDIAFRKHVAKLNQQLIFEKYNIEKSISILERNYLELIDKR